METVYVETTVVSYLVSRSSRDVVIAGHQQVTREWWDECRHDFACFTSDLVVAEAREGDARQAALREEALAGLPRLAVSEEAERLAEAFLAGGILPENAAADALHLAMATIASVDYLLTWNCRHLANARLLNPLEDLAAGLGYRMPRVCTPEALMGNSRDD